MVTSAMAGPFVVESVGRSDGVGAGSPVRIRATTSMGVTQTLPSPIFSVRAPDMMASTAAPT